MGQSMAGPSEKTQQQWRAIAQAEAKRNGHSTSTGTIREAQGAFVKMGFRKADDRVVTMTVTQQPLAVGFEADTPIIINSVMPNSHAEAIGMKVGMKLVSIDGEDVEHHSYDHQLVQLFRATKRLPQANPLTPLQKKVVAADMHIDPTMMGA